MYVSVCVCVCVCLCLCVCVSVFMCVFGVWIVLNEWVWLIRIIVILKHCTDARGVKMRSEK